MATNGTTFLFIADLHLGDNRETVALPLGDIAAVINRLGPDVVVNLNDTVAPQMRLVATGPQSPAEQYLELWHAYGRELRGRLRMPVIDVGTPRDLAIWEQVTRNPPHGTEAVGQVRLLWLCPETGSAGLSPSQLTWASEEIASHAGATWAIASHAPVRGSTPWDSAHFLKGADALKDAIRQYAARGVFVGGHFHISHSEPLRDGNCLCMIGGGMNQMKSGGHSYAKLVTFLPDRVRADEVHLNAGTAVETWEFAL